jgi:hypothetical protein
MSTDAAARAAAVIAVFLPVTPPALTGRRWDDTDPDLHPAILFRA